MRVAVEEHHVWLALLVVQELRQLVVLVVVEMVEPLMDKQAQLLTQAVVVAVEELMVGLAVQE
jgi:hypothetical protein